MVYIRLSFRFLSFSLCGPLEQQNSQDDKFFFLLIGRDEVIRFFLSQKEFYASPFLKQILVCAYTIW